MESKLHSECKNEGNIELENRVIDRKNKINANVCFSDLKEPFDRYFMRFIECCNHKKCDKCKYKKGSL